jgi:hypothetical protein
LAARSPESRLAMNFFAAVQLRADLQLGSKHIANALSLLFGLRLLHRKLFENRLNFG